MDCGSCVMNIDGVLEDIDGVEESRTSFTKELTTVTFNANKVTPQTLMKQLEVSGYEAIIVD